jgi:hypothetical protein
LTVANFKTSLAAGSSDFTPRFKNFQWIKRRAAPFPRELEEVQMTAADGLNAPNPAEFIALIDAADSELLALRSKYMDACKAPRGKIKTTMSLAREAGLNMTAFREILKLHRDERRQDIRLTQLEADDFAAYQEMLELLGDYGDTPLGAAALAKAKPRGEDSLDSLGG